MQNSTKEVDVQCGPPERRISEGPEAAGMAFQSTHDKGIKRDSGSRPAYAIDSSVKRHVTDEERLEQGRRVVASSISNMFSGLLCNGSISYLMQMEPDQFWNRNIPTVTVLSSGQHAPRML